MTRAKTPLEQTPWAKAFRADSPVSYPEAIRLARDPTLRVELTHNNDTGEWKWAICAVSHDPGFWMDAKPTKKAALELCRTMGWKLFRST